MSRQDSAPDELFDLKAFFFTGNYQACIDEGQKVRVVGDKATERDLFVFRSYIAQSKFRVVLDAIKPSADASLKAIKMYSEFMAANPERKGTIITQLEEMLQKDASNDTLVLVTASALFTAGNHEAALRCLHQSNDLECLNLSVKILLSINRVDLAAKEQKKMCEMDEDSILTQLATAWLNVARGGPKVQDAYHIFQDLQERFQSTPFLLNSVAVCHLSQGRLEEAMECVKEAYDKDNSNVETLVNYVTVLSLSGKNEMAKRYVSQLHESHPQHPIVLDWVTKESEFDMLSSQILANRAM